MLDTIDVQKRDIIRDPSLILDLPLFKLDGGKFTSRDAYGHLCTVTGALWRPDGRFFDGSDDFINVGTVINSYLATDQAFSIALWMKTGSDASPMSLFSNSSVSSPNIGIDIAKTGVASPKILVDLIQTIVGSKLIEVRSELLVTLDDDTWHQVVITYNGSLAAAGMLFYFNGAGKSVDILVDNVDAGATSSDNLQLGARDGSNQAFGGNIGGVWVYSRVLSIIEIQRNYLATKWRYQ